MGSVARMFAATVSIVIDEVATDTVVGADGTDGVVIVVDDFVVVAGCVAVSGVVVIVAGAVLDVAVVDGGGMTVMNRISTALSII